MTDDEVRSYLSEDERRLFDHFVDPPCEITAPLRTLARTRKELWRLSESGEHEVCPFCGAMFKHETDCIFHDMPGKDAKR